MNTSPLCIVLSLALGGSAFAAEREAKIPPPHCGTIEAMKASAGGLAFTALTPGQFHFAAGIYVGSPMTPPGGLPPGDGGLLVDYGHGKGGVVWTRGKQACITIIVTDAEHHQGAYTPMPVDLKMMAAIKTGVDETLAPDDSSEERKL